MAKKSVNPEIDPQHLAIFLLCATQDGWVDDLLPPAGGKVDLKKFTDLGLDTAVLNAFVAKYKGSGATVRAHFGGVLQHFKDLDFYHDPPCPTRDALVAIVAATQ